MVDYSEGLMNNNGDGTYTYNFVVEKPGTFSILVYSRQSSYIQATLFSGRWLDGSSSTEIWSTINQPAISRFQSSTYISNLKGPT